jgi:LPXTG-motif cell wall-anchored protein
LTIQADQEGGMNAKRIRRWAAGAALSVAVLSGGTAAASSYPPDDPTPSTVLSGGQSSGQSGIRQPGSELAATGSDTGTTLYIAAGAVVTGAGLLVATRLRRRTAPA